MMLGSHPLLINCKIKTVSMLCAQDPEEKKIALELLETEQSYVSRLHLLDQVGWQPYSLMSCVQKVRGEHLSNYLTDMPEATINVSLGFPSPVVPLLGSLFHLILGLEHC